jgi:hypothetical protein
MNSIRMHSPLSFWIVDIGRKAAQELMFLLVIHTPEFI